MKTRILHLLDGLKESIWFIPLLCVIVGLALAAFARWMDSEVLDASKLMLAGFQPGSTEGVRSVFATIGSTMIGLAGVSFSITVVTLSLASSQFGPRLLRNFTRDPSNHLVLGILMGVFVYSLALLATVRSSGEDDFETPVVGLSLAFLLALLGLGAFAYFVNNVAVSIQATEVVARVHEDLCTSIDRFFPKDDAVNRHLTSGEIELLPHRSRGEYLVNANRSGYLLVVAIDSLVDLASQADVVIELRVHPGAFLIEGTTVITVYFKQGMPEELAEKIAGNLLQGNSRTTEQDFEFSIAQLVEIAVRALSPGVNDPFTATNSIDYLGSAYARIGARKLPQNVFQDEDGNVRVILLPVNFPEILAAGITQIRQNAKASPAVVIRMIEMLTEIVPAMKRGTDRHAVLQQARTTAAGALSQSLEELDKDAIQQRLARIEALVAQSSQCHNAKAG